MGDAGAAVGRMVQTVLQNHIFHLLRYPVRMRAFGSGQAVEESLRSVGLVVPTDFIELLAAVPAKFAGFRDIAKFLSKF